MSAVTEPCVRTPSQKYRRRSASNASLQSLWCSLSIFKWSLMSVKALALRHAVGGWQQAPAASSLSALMVGLAKETRVSQRKSDRAECLISDKNYTTPSRLFRLKIMPWAITHTRVHVRWVIGPTVTLTVSPGQAAFSQMSVRRSFAVGPRLCLKPAWKSGPRTLKLWKAWFRNLFGM